MVYYLDAMNEKLKKKAEAFFLRFRQIKLEKGELVLKADRTLTDVFYLKNGYVREYTGSAQGVELTLHVFAPGSFFPMTDLLAGIKNRYYYEALTSVELYVAAKEKVLEFFKREPDVVMELTRRLLLGLDKLLMRIEYLAYGKAEEKIISTLLFLARHFGRQKNNGVQIQYLFTHKDIASFAGVSRETASRELEKLLKRNLIAYKKHLITINDIRQLEEQGAM